jgi:hypothetical protein
MPLLLWVIYPCVVWAACADMMMGAIEPRRQRRDEP